MVKNIKKRSVSETEVTVKKEENKAFKKTKIENKAIQNGQDKQAKNLKTGMKTVKNAGPVQSLNKKDSNVTSKNSGKQVLSNKKNQVKSSGDTQGQKKKKPWPKHGTLTADELKAKIENITSRGELSRTAKRKLALLRKLLRMQEGNLAQGTQQQQSQKAKNENSLEVVRNKLVQSKQQNKKLQGQLETKSKIQNKKRDTKQAHQFVTKQQKEDDDEEDDENEEDDMDSELSKDEDESGVEEEEEEEEEDEEGESEEEVEDEEESEDEESEKDEKKDDKAKTNSVQPAKEKESNKTEGDAKKKRYVVFVGNLPYSITSEELKKHFLTKVNHIVNIRIPTKDGNTSRGFAYVELANNTDFEKAFSLNHSVINGRRINVQYSGTNKKEGVAKNFKLNALQKAGKFAGGKNKYQQKNFNKKK